MTWRHGLPPSLLSQDALRIIQPVLLGYLVSYFSADSTMSMRDAFLYALGVSLCSVVGSFFMTPFVFLRSLYGMRLRVACTALVYNKVNCDAVQPDIPV